jgi:hypothetical protein
LAIGKPKKSEAMPAVIKYLASLNLPPANVAKTLATFMEGFYAITDDPTAHEKYADQFTRDAVLIMGSKKAEGYDRMSHPTSESDDQSISLKAEHPISSACSFLLFSIFFFDLRGKRHISNKWSVMYYKHILLTEHT